MGRNVKVSIFATLFGVFVFVFPTVAAAEEFFVDESFDSKERSEITATQRVQGEHSRIYVEDSYWNSLSSSVQNARMDDLQNISDTFDKDIYSSVRDVYGSEWKPGIDGDEKVVILFTDIQSGFGGYFRSDDEQPSSAVSDSNEREMFYINTSFIDDERQANAFLAHEFQHLINYNQKNRIRNVQEKTWVNEMLSEVAPTIAGLNESYAGSNLSDRVDSFLNNPTDALTRWGNTGSDYGVASVFGHYLLDHYGEDFFTAVVQNDKTGIDTINAALAKENTRDKFGDVFNNWAITVLVNDCNIRPLNTFCYLDPDLGHDNLHITFTTGESGGTKVSSTNSTFPWQGSWRSYSRDLENNKPDDHIFVYTFEKEQGSKFKVPYVVYEEGKNPRVSFLNIEGNTGKVAVENFGFTVDQVVAMPLNHSGDLNTLYEYQATGELSEEVPEDTTGSTPASDTPEFKDGTLVRAEGTEKVYIIKGPYKRWVQSADIINMYGHLSFEDVVVTTKEVLREYEEVDVIKTPDSEKIWWVTQDGRKRWLQTEEEFKSLGYSFDMIYTVNQAELDWYPVL